MRGPPRATSLILLIIEHEFPAVMSANSFVFEEIRWETSQTSHEFFPSDLGNLQERSQVT